MRQRSKLSATGLVLGLVLGLPAAATAAPAAPTAAPPTPAPTGRPDNGRTSATVTLVTGDQVTVTATGASVRPAEGREGIRFLTQRQRNHLWVLPQDALPLIRDGRVDRRLFDVAGLIAAGYDDAHRDDLPLLMTYGATARRAGAPDGVTVTRDLTAIGGVAPPRTSSGWASSGPRSPVPVAPGSTRRGVSSGSGSTADGS